MTQLGAYSAWVPGITWIRWRPTFFPMFSTISGKMGQACLSAQRLCKGYNLAVCTSTRPAHSWPWAQSQGLKAEEALTKASGRKIVLLRFKTVSALDNHLCKKKMTESKAVLKLKECKSAHWRWLKMAMSCWGGVQPPIFVTAVLKRHEINVPSSGDMMARQSHHVWKQPNTQILIHQLHKMYVYALHFNFSLLSILLTWFTH